MLKSNRIAQAVIFSLIAFAAIIILVYAFWGRYAWDNIYQVQIEKAYLERNYSKVINLAEKRKKFQPSDIQPYLIQIQVYFDKKRGDKIEEVVQQATDSPSLTDAQVSGIMSACGDLYNEINDYENAREFYKRAYKLSDDLIANYNFAQISLRLGDFKSAQEALDVAGMESIGDDVNTLRAYLDLSENSDFHELVEKAREFLREGYPYLAIKILEPEVESMADYWPGLYILGLSYFEIEDYDKALDYFIMTEEAGSDLPELFTYQARTQYFRNKNFESIELYKRALLYSEEDEEKAIIQNEAFEVAVDTDQYERALEFAAEIESNPNTLPQVNYMRYVEVYFLKKDYENVREYLDKISEYIYSDSREDTKMKYEYHLYSARYFIYKGLDTNDKKLVKNARGHLRDLSRLGYEYSKYLNSPEVEFLWGRYYHEIGRRRRAKLAYQRTIEYDLGGELTEKSKTQLAYVD